MEEELTIMNESHNYSIMRGSSIKHKKRQYVTHTTLPSYLSAVQTFSWGQRITILVFLSLMLGGFFFSPLVTLQLLVGFISILYFSDTLFNFVLTFRSIHKPTEIIARKKELQSLKDEDLPVYTILCPLYKESHIIPQFVKAIANLDYPKDKLDVILLLEEDDTESIENVSQMHLPYYFRTIVVPDSQPKTKPKACNYGLSFASGEYLVIFDAEDMPEPSQLKKALIGFQKVPSEVVCLQAKLNYYNARQNVLTRFFTAEYSLWFDLTLTGLQSFNSTIPLGGTSNHFKTKVLQELEGWDPFNVTEDADLGVRLFKKGYKTAVIDSTTYEEATSKIKNWIRQRSRWIKGYMQTYLVHMRSWKSFIKEQGIVHTVIFQLTIGGKLLFLLVNPLMWIITAGYFFAYPLFGPTIESIYAGPIAYLAVFSWIFGNFLFLYYYMLGCAKRNQWDLMKYVFLIPLYWGMMSIAAAMALYQLIFKPHYWEKTVHGFHLQKRQPSAILVIAPVLQPSLPAAPRQAFIPAQKIFAFFSARNEQVTTLFWQTLPIVSLLALDVIVAKLFLPADTAQQYFFLSMTGKALAMIMQGIAHITNGLFAKRKKAVNRFYDLIFSVFLFQWIAFILFGYEGSQTLPLIFGDTVFAILPYLSYYLFAMMCFGISLVFIRYHTKKRQYTFAFVSLALMLLQGIFFIMTKATIQELAVVSAYFGTVNLIAMIFLHIQRDTVAIVQNNINSLLSIFNRSIPVKAWKEKRMRILIFNWRDTRHIWAGGAEVYVQELAKRWVKDGNQVTLFCSNDNHNPSDERIDGVHIIRRGGMYTVYLFALLYYLFSFRNKYDVIVDCENGIPFFTPLFTRKPVILVVHHIHQQIFRAFLKFPLRQIAAFLEGEMMPYVYRNKVIVTVSESSKQEILGLKFIENEKIEVIHNGVDSTFATLEPKTIYPSFIYVGRLKEYKKIDIAIKAFAAFHKEYPDARLSIVGSGEEDKALEKLVAKLSLAEHVTFFGRVSEKRKAELLAQSWAMIQPSQIEGWGLTVIEANACGTPVIASNVNGLKDSVVDGQTGILVPVNNIHGFTDAMKLIASNTVYRNTLSKNAYSWSKKFDWNTSANEFYRIIGRSLDKQIWKNLDKQRSRYLAAPKKEMAYAVVNTLQKVETNAVE